MSSIESVNITIGSNMYSRFENFANTSSNVLAEFIDNALQSYRDNRDVLHSLNPDYHFSVHIEFLRDETGKEIKEIKVTDNAAGIPYAKYLNAFEPAKKPTDDSGLNEFGMGLKTAACWLGDNWEVTSKALNESEERVFHFDLNQVTANDLRVLPVMNTPRPVSEHYTIIHIGQLSKNAPSDRGIEKIKSDLASIYRLSLRREEIRLVVDNELLEFKNPEILKAPYFKEQEGPIIEWKKDINFEFEQYKAHGYIGILKDMSSANNGFVLLRRGRVVVGAENGQRYFPKCLCGNVGSPRYKRIFGELELEGFKVSFNKNDILDKDNLDALMEGLKGLIHTKDFDLYAQAEGYRLDERKKQAKKLVKKHDTSKKEDRKTIEISTDPNKSCEITPITLFPELEKVEEIKDVGSPVVFEEYEDKYRIDGTNFTLKVQFVDRGQDLFWVDVSQIVNSIIICKINTGHAFFEHFGKPNEATIAILKTMAVAKYTAKIKADNDAVKMLEFFNEYIKRTKV
ncbi:MAG: ATP-binding protein [Paludibacteraceae bacterium]|nr:ATP-binding protein [Paludibacteraceae bacterium]